MTSIIPHLMFQGRLNDALALWERAFGALDLNVLAKDDAGKVVQAHLTLHGQKISLFDSPPVHDFTFTPAISLMVTCDIADEVERLAGILGDGGKVMMPLDTYDFSERFTWIEDPFGVSWQLMVAA